MCVERMRFFRNVEFCQHVIHDCGERTEVGPGFDSNPEHSRRTRGGKESIATNADFDRAPLNRFQRALDFLDLVLGFLADKLERDVQRFGPHPSSIWSESTYAVQERGDASANIVVDIESDKKAHRKSSLHQLPAHH